jgi:hypothetical protein
MIIGVRQLLIKKPILDLQLRLGGEFWAAPASCAMGLLVIVYRRLLE